MGRSTVENVTIVETSLGREEHGIMTAYILVRGDGVSASFGGYFLDNYDEARKRRVGVAFGIAFVMGVLDTLEVRSWEQLTGKSIRIEWSDSGRIARIGHLIKDKWFDPRVLGKEMKNGQALDSRGE